MADKHPYILQHEMDHEPSYIVRRDNEDFEIAISPGQYDLAVQIRDLLNSAIPAPSCPQGPYVLARFTNAPSYLVDERDDEVEITIAPGYDHLALRLRDLLNGAHKAS